MKNKSLHWWLDFVTENRGNIQRDCRGTHQRNASLSRRTVDFKYRVGEVRFYFYTSRGQPLRAAWVNYENPDRTKRISESMMLVFPNVGELPEHYLQPIFQRILTVQPKVSETLTTILDY